MRGLSLWLCRLLAVLASRPTVRAADTTTVPTSTNTAPVLRIEASPVQSIPLAVYNNNDDDNGVFTYYDDSSDDDDDDDDDADSDDDAYIPDVFTRSDDLKGQQQHDRFTLARQWHVHPASSYGGDEGGRRSLYPGAGTFQLELNLPGRVFVRVLKDDPDYDAERKKFKHSDSDRGSDVHLTAKVVAMANASTLLNAISVVEGPDGWSIVSASPATVRLADELVVFVYLDAANGSHLGSVVSKGVGDVVVTKKAIPTKGAAFSMSSQGDIDDGRSGGGSVYLLAHDAIHFVSLTLDVVGSSSLYLHFPSSISIADKLAMTVDGSGSIIVKSEHTSTAQLASSVSGGGNGDICFAASHLQTSLLNATVAQNGSITIRSEHASSYVENLEIDGVGMIDTGVVNAVHTSVVITDGPAGVIVGSAISLEYSAPPSSHVWYRGSRPIFVVAAPTPGAVSSVPLEKQSGPRAKQCRAVTVPSEPRAVSLIEKGASASASVSTTTTTISTLPSSSREKSLSPEAVKALEGEDDPDKIMKILFPDAAGLIPSSPTHTGGELESGGDSDGPIWESAPPWPPSPQFKFPEPSGTESPIPGLLPQPQTTVPSIAPSPSTVLPVVPVSTIKATPSASTVLIPLPSNDSTSPTPVSTSGAIVTGPTATAPTVTDIALILGVAFVVFSWLLHLALQCCDQRSRRHYYQSINNDRQQGSTTARNDDDEDPPVFI